MFKKLEKWFYGRLRVLAEVVGYRFKNPHIIFGKMIGIKGERVE